MHMAENVKKKRNSVYASDQKKRTAKKSTKKQKNYIPPDLELKKGKVREKIGKWFVLMVFLTLLEAAMDLSALNGIAEEQLPTVLLLLGGYLAAQWVYYIVAGLMLRRRMELEMAGFLLSNISLVITASVYPDRLTTQLVAVIGGILVFAFLVWFMGNVNRVTVSRMPIGLAAVGLLALTLVLAEYNNGAKNWLYLGSFSIQPSEIVKVAFVFVGAATLDKIQNTRSIAKYVVFAMVCVGLLFLMLDFGTALIFFATFLIIAFLRSGDIKTIVLICTAALMGGVFIILYKPYVANRFATYRHIWDYIDAGGMQQTRTIIYSLSGAERTLTQADARAHFRTIHRAIVNLPKKSSQVTEVLPLEEKDLNEPPNVFGRSALFRIRIAGDFRTSELTVFPFGSKIVKLRISSSPYAPKDEDLSYFTKAVCTAFNAVR